MKTVLLRSYYTCSLEMICPVRPYRERTPTFGAGNGLSSKNTEIVRLRRAKEMILVQILGYFTCRLHRAELQWVEYDIIS